MLRPLSLVPVLLLLGSACSGTGSLDSPPLADDDTGAQDDDTTPTDDDTTESDDDTTVGDDDSTPEEDESAWLFDDEGIVQIDVTLTQAALDSLSLSPYVWVEADATLDGEPMGVVGFRLKGQNSFRPFPEKSAFKIDFDRFGGTEAWDIDGITLNNMVSDPTYVHEAVAYRLFRETGRAAPRSAHATVSINGEDYGVYALIEDIDHDFLERWYEDPDGSMWEVWDVDFYDFYVSSFQWESGKDDRSIIQSVADALETPGEAGLLAAFEFIDRESFLAYWGTAAVVAQFDSWPYGAPGDDCHIYWDPTDGHLDFIPHGMDESLTEPGRLVEGVNGSLAARCLSDSPACRAQFHDHIGASLALAEAIDLRGIAEETMGRISLAVSHDPKAFYSQADIQAWQGALLDLIDGRRGELEAQLGPL